ncbi:tRNA lysidine(34) synthetase TilS [Pseudoxanthomonas kalamensis DSM 18571]|uniref:tRNA lysidine(34) synthetase TilS n=1 Tax=Pseudoxanthomonas kalamensis TaxID=289483 RepID=UPI0013916662|nr:tRNA lysidine(34) synthetase TilS [Pseudoxanthomonas kalamensis]KAF1710371.1 tRNA lysidine(34) synthetase TilS [Pseudoxanthomonas kalamensis DSM 18571]
MPLFLPALPLPDAPLMIAFSGGLDSTVLLHAVTAGALAGNEVRAVHVHHGLQSHADDWERHCRSVCESLRVPLEVLRVRVERDGGQGPEAAAREARYAALMSLLRPGEVLLTAHHRDDQAETFLLRALRASSVEGLAAMRPWRRFGPGWHWRPLLGIGRDALFDHAHAEGLRWIEDASNDDTALDRNYLRHRVLPLLRQRWPQADAAFARSAELSGEAANLLADEDRRVLAACGTLDPQALSVTALRALPIARRARVLRRWIRALQLPPLPAEGIARIESELLSARDDAQARFDWGDGPQHAASVRRWRDVLHAEFLRQPLPTHWQQPWDGRLPLILPGGGLLSLENADALPMPVQAHARQGGERIALPGRSHSHELKKLLQDAGVPPWTRESLPLLSDEAGNLLAAGDLLYSAGFDDWLRRHGARLRWRERSAAGADATGLD